MVLLVILVWGVAGEFFMFLIIFFISCGLFLLRTSEAVIFMMHFSCILNVEWLPSLRSSLTVIN